MRHRVEPRVHDFVVHREDEHVLEELLQKRLQGLGALAVDVPLLAGGRGMGLGRQAGRSDYEDAVLRQRARQVADERGLAGAIDVLQHIEAVGGVEISAEGPIEHVVQGGLHGPGRVLAAFDVGDERGIEVQRCHHPHFLLNDPRAERVGAADFEDAPGTAQHFGGELVARKDDAQTAWVIVPNLIGHQAKAGQALPRGKFEGVLILRLFRLPWRSNRRGAKLTQKRCNHSPPYILPARTPTPIPAASRRRGR